MDLSALVALYPNLLPILAAVPVVQLVAGLLANLPRLWGVTHDTIWSRGCRTVASLPVLYKPVAPPPDLPLVPSNPPRGWIRLGFLILFLLGGFVLISLSGCAALSKGLGTIENAPVQSACVAFKDPVYDSTKTKICTQVCVSTDPPQVLWQCQPVPPAAP